MGVLLSFNLASSCSSCRIVASLSSFSSFISFSGESGSSANAALPSTTWSEHFVEKFAGQVARCVWYLHLVGPEDDRVCSSGSLWHHPHTILTDGLILPVKCSAAVSSDGELCEVLDGDLGDLQQGAQLVRIASLRLQLVKIKHEQQRTGPPRLEKQLQLT